MYYTNYIRNIAIETKNKADGWQLLLDILSKSNLTEEQWVNVNLALEFPVGLEKSKS